MADQPRYEISHSLGSGYDFYTADAGILATASLSIQSSVIVSLTQEFFVSIQLDSSADILTNAHRIIFAESSLSIDGVTVVVAVERQDALVDMSASVDVQVTAQKISFSQSALDSAVDLAISIIKESLASSLLEVSSNLEAQAIKILLATSDMSSLADLQVSSVKIAYAAADLSVDGAVITIAVERQDAAVALSASADMQVVVTKIAFAKFDGSGLANVQIQAFLREPISANLSSSVNMVTAATRLRTASANLSSSANLTAVATRFKLASALLSGEVSMFVMGKIILATIRINAIQNVSVTAKAIKFSTVTGVDTTSLRTVLLLDGKPLTNQNRNLQISSTPVFIENNNWNGTSSRYYKNTSTGDRKTFSLSWSFIPNFREKTVDLNHARDYIRKAALDPDVHTLKIINQDASGLTPYTETTYNVFVKDFSENLVRRDLVDDVYYWDCSVVLEEA